VKNSKNIFVAIFHMTLQNSFRIVTHKM